MKSNPDNETQGREDSQLTAFLLGELDPAVHAVIQSQLESDPELNERFQSLKQSSDWLLNVAKSGVFSNNQSDEQWKLSEPSRSELLRRLRQSHSDVSTSATSKWQTLFNAGLSSWLTRFGAPIAACFLACLAALIFILPQLQMARSSAVFSPDMARMSAEDSAESMDFYESDGIVTDFDLPEEPASSSIERYSYFSNKNEISPQELDSNATTEPQAELFASQTERLSRSAGRQVRVAETMTKVAPAGPDDHQNVELGFTDTLSFGIETTDESRPVVGFRMQSSTPAQVAQEIEELKVITSAASQKPSPRFSPPPATPATPAPTEPSGMAGGLGVSGSSNDPFAIDSRLVSDLEGQTIVTATAPSAESNNNLYWMRNEDLGEAVAPSRRLDSKSIASDRDSSRGVTTLDAIPDLNSWGAQGFGSDFTSPSNGGIADQPSDKPSRGFGEMEISEVAKAPSNTEHFFDSRLSSLNGVKAQGGSPPTFLNEKAGEVTAGARFGTQESSSNRDSFKSKVMQREELSSDKSNARFDVDNLGTELSLGKTLEQIVELEDSISLGRKKLRTAEPQTESRRAQSKKSAIKEVASRDFQEEIPVAENEFSTFALQVRDVSFESALAALQNGALPDPSTMRSEEFLNAFDYGMPEPDQASKLGFDYELSGFPFEHQRLALRVSLKTAALGRESSRPLNLVAALDNSGSMERPDRAAITQGAFQKLTELLGPQDRLSVIAFSRQPRLWAEAMAGGNPAEVLARLGQLNPEGGTNLEAALDLAYEVAQRNFIPNGENRVVLLTDGAANLGQVDPESLAEKVMDNRRQGIALDTFGIGWDGLNDPLLERLSRNGDGRYAFMNDPLSAPTEFANELAGALQVAAKQVKIQMEWNPGRLKSYRLIGYAKNRLTAEQFRDNSVDAGELAAREAGSAIYTLELVPNGTGPIATARARYQDPDSGTFKEKTWIIPYQSAPSLDEASPAQQLAVVSSLFGEWLSQAPRAEQYLLNELMNSLRSAKGSFAFNPRVQQLEFMIQQAQSLTVPRP